LRKEEEEEEFIQNRKTLKRERWRELRGGKRECA